MFWGLVMKVNKNYPQTVKRAFHLSMARLNLYTCGDADVQVMLNTEYGTHLLCTLSKDIPQVELDLNFAEGDQICFSSKGEGLVLLNGYLTPNDPNSDDDEDTDVIASCLSSAAVTVSSLIMAMHFMQAQLEGCPKDELEGGEEVCVNCGLELEGLEQDEQDEEMFDLSKGGNEEEWGAEDAEDSDDGEDFDVEEAEEEDIVIASCKKSANATIRNMKMIIKFLEAGSQQQSS